MELHLGDADDLISFARMLEEESDDLCKELGIEGKHIEAQEAELAKTIERPRSDHQKHAAFATAPSDESDSTCKISHVDRQSYRIFSLPLKNVERLRAALTLPLSVTTPERNPTRYLTGRVSGVIESSFLASDLDSAATARLVNINSGGEVYFTFFNGEGGKESAVVLKFGPNRMATQGEALAYEIAAALHIPSPKARIIRADSDEWVEISRGVRALQQELECRKEKMIIEGQIICESKESCEQGNETLCTEQYERGGRDPSDDIITSCDMLAQSLETKKCALAIELVQGCPLARMAPDNHEAHMDSVAFALGQLFALDLILGNPDRLPNRALGWRGNPNNVRWEMEVCRVRGIDHTLARRPPRGLLCTPDSVAAITDVLLDRPVDVPLDTTESQDCRRNRTFHGFQTKKDVVEGAVEAIFPDMHRERGADTQATLEKNFCGGFQDVVRQAPTLLGSLEEMIDLLDRELGMFFMGLRSNCEDTAMASTKALRQIQSRVRSDQHMKESFEHAETSLARCLQTETQDRSSPSSCCGVESFINSPDMVSVNAYELRVRLRHVHDRLKAMVFASKE